MEDQRLFGRGVRIVRIDDAQAAAMAHNTSSSLGGHAGMDRLLDDSSLGSASRSQGEPTEERFGIVGGIGLIAVSLTVVFLIVGLLNISGRLWKPARSIKKGAGSPAPSSAASDSDEEDPGEALLESACEPAAGGAPAAAPRATGCPGTQAATADIEVTVLPPRRQLSPTPVEVQTLPLRLAPGYQNFAVARPAMEMQAPRVLRQPSPARAPQGCTATPRWGAPAPPSAPASSAAVVTFASNLCEPDRAGSVFTTSCEAHGTQATPVQTREEYKSPLPPELSLLSSSPTLSRTPSEVAGQAGQRLVDQTAALQGLRDQSMVLQTYLHSPPVITAPYSA